MAPDIPSQDGPYNILSLDGGGSRGVMEAITLKDAMACLTLVQRGQLEVDRLDFATEEGRKWMRERLDSVEEPIHPGDVFEMIAGTSTGALMAFGLLHGKNGKRMSLEEIVELYEKHTTTIFPSWPRSFRSWWPKRLTFFKWPGLPIPIPSYSQDGLEKVLKEKFGDQSLASVRGDEKSIAAAVARKQHPPDRPYLEIFDTRPDIPLGRRVSGTLLLKLNPSLVEVLKASACAPVYFEAPTNIGTIGYIDGGVGGNCPLGQAIPRMRNLVGTDRHLQTVISIAPPAPREKDTKWKKGLLGCGVWLGWVGVLGSVVLGCWVGEEGLLGCLFLELLGCWGVGLLVYLFVGLMQWLTWFPKQLTDGFFVYNEQVKANRGRDGKEAMFHRLSPQSEETKTFKLDSWDIEGMKECMRIESLTDFGYFANISLVALMLAPSDSRNYKEVSNRVEQIFRLNADHEKKQGVPSYGKNINLAEKVTKARNK